MKLERALKRKFKGDCQGKVGMSTGKMRRERGVLVENIRNARRLERKSDLLMNGGD